MSLSFGTKDPDAILDYSVDWSVWLDTGDTLFTSTWIVPDGISENSSSHTDTVTTIWLSDGEVGQTYTLVNRVETTGGRTDDRTVKIRVKEK